MPCKTGAVDEKQRQRERQAAAGRWLRTERERAGYATLGQFARALGIDQSQVSRYELGTSAISDERAERIAKVLGIDIVTARRNLGLWVPPEPPRSPMDKAEAGLDRNERLAAEIRELRARERRAVEAFIAELTKDPAETRETEDENHR